MKVKALSFRQPWAELVLQGRKTVDLRTWNTRYRGPLAIYASQTVEKERCRAHGLDPEQLTTGAVIGLVDLVGVVKLDEASYAARAAEHLGGRHFQTPLYGWELANPRALAEPLPTRGHLNLFEVELPGLEASKAGEPAAAPAQPRQREVHKAPPPGGVLVEPEAHGLPFELRVTPESEERAGQTSYRLGVYQRKMEAPAAQRSLYQPAGEAMERVVELGGTALRAVADQVLEALRENGYRATELNPNRSQPFGLSEEWGVRLALLFLAARPVSKVNRIEVISAGVRAMSSEELYYWYSKCTARTSAERAQKALRILLAGE